MTTTLRTAMAALLLSATPFAAQAADLDVIEAPIIEDTPSQLYIAARLGVSQFRDTTFDLNNAAVVPTDISNEYDDNLLTGFLAAGLDTNAGARMEIEVGYGEYDINSHTVRALNARFGDGDGFGTANVTTVMGNAYYDLRLGRFAPYLSVGLGVGHASFENYGIVTPDGGVAGLSGGPVVALNDDGFGLAWQVGAGVSVDVTKNVALEFGYRYSGLQGVQVDAIDGTDTSLDLRAHTGMIGLRYAF